VEAEGRGAAGMLSGLDMGGTSPTATALRIATEKFKQHPTDPALQKAEDDALHAFIQAATSRWDRELAAKAMQMERQIAALRKATDDLNNRVSNLNTP